MMTQTRFMTQPLAEDSASLKDLYDVVQSLVKEI